MRKNHWLILFFIMMVGAMGQSTLQADSANLQNAIFAYKKGKYEASAAGFYDAAKDPFLKEYQIRSLLFLANSLFHLGFRTTSLDILIKIVKIGPNNPYFKPAVGKALVLSQMLGGSTPLLKALSKIPPEHYPLQYQERLQDRKST